MLQFKKASWSDEKIQSCKDELNNLFFEAVGKGEKRMNPHAVDILHEDRIEIAETIINLINQEVTNVNPLPLLVDQVEGDIRNNYIWQELDSSLRVVTRAYGSRPLSQRLTFKEHSMKTEMRETNVEIPLEEVFSGRQTPALAASEMALAITRFRIANTVDLIDAAVPSSTNDRTGITGYTLRYVDSGNLSQANLDAAIDGLQDEGDNITVFGRHVALFPAIRSFTDNVSQDIQTDLFNRGVVAQYHGANILTLKDPYAKRSADHLIRKDRIYVASGTKGAVYMTKPVEFLNYSFVDPKTATFGAGLRMEDGIVMHDAYRYRILEIAPAL
jgi:hypothetical protein